ncbi:MAG: hypothetical protein M3Q74_04190 [Pseudomonadota bacterium]|nr:hypothetical protein [Pseudomonadota bacterium]
MDRRTLLKGIAGAAAGLVLPTTVGENAEAVRRYWALDRTMVGRVVVRHVDDYLPRLPTWAGFMDAFASIPIVVEIAEDPSSPSSPSCRLDGAPHLVAWGAIAASGLPLASLLQEFALPARPLQRR